MTRDEIKNIIEGILFSIGDSIGVSEIAKAINLSEKETENIIEEMKDTYEKEKRGIRITKIENKYQMSSSKDVNKYLIKIIRQPKKCSLTEVLLETLSIIAYKQPVTKSEIEKIRGVSSDHAINKLVKYNLVEEVGRKDAPGKPMMFGTTEEFLRSFGLQSMEDLPTLNPVEVEEWRLTAEEEVDKTLNR